MKNKLTKEEVLHVAHLARISLEDKEIDKYCIQLKELLDEVEKINLIESYDNEMMFTPVEEESILREDVVGEMLDAKTAVKNAPKRSGNFMEVPVMIND